MVLDLKRIFAVEGSEIVIDHTLDMSDVDWAGSYPLKDPVIIKGFVQNRSGVVQLKLDMAYTFSSLCDRCGDDAVTDYNVEFDKLLAVSIEGEDSDTIITVPDMKLDIDELVFAEIILSLPSKHLCKEDCKGICPKCGKNLNKGACECPDKEIDPRLAKLAELLNN